MSDSHTTEWAYSLDEDAGDETWEGGYTRATAIRAGRLAAQQYGSRCLTAYKIGRVTYPSLHGYGPAADEVLDILHENIRDNIWSGAEPPDVTDEAEAALGTMLDAVFGAWVDIFDVRSSAFVVEPASVEIIPLTDTRDGDAP